MNRIGQWVARQSRPVRLGLATVTAGVCVYAGHSAWKVGRAEWYFQRATAAENQRDFATARHHLSECLIADPTSGRFLFHAAQVARRDGDFTTARRLLELAGKHGWPDDATDWERTLLSAQTGGFAGAEAKLRRAVEVAPDDPETELVLEVLVPGYMAQFQMAEAYTVLDEWCNRKPDALRPRLWMFDVARRLMISQRAIEVAREAVVIAPDNPDARSKCADILIENHQPAEAKPHFEWLLERNSQNPAARFGLAKCLRELGDEAGAARELDAILRDYPERADYLTERGVLEMQAGRPMSARDWLRRAVEANPTNTDLLYNYALCLEQCGATAEAKVWRERHTRTEADLMELKDVTKQIAGDPKNTALRHKAGELMLRNGLGREGVRWIRSALSVDPRHEPSRKTLNDYYKQVQESVGK